VGRHAIGIDLVKALLTETLGRRQWILFFIWIPRGGAAWQISRKRIQNLSALPKQSPTAFLQGE
jgi:hypothetical protein